MPTPRGRSLPLSLPRRCVCDLLYFAARTPTVPARRRMTLTAVTAARAAAVPRVGWCALFLKAYGLVAAARPELRRCYLGWPTPRLYEHPVSAAAVAVERDWHGESAVLVAQKPHPERSTLAELEAWVRSVKESPVDEVPSFRRLLRAARLPRPVRRLGWWLALNAVGRWRAKHLGTFGLSSVAGLGAELPNLLSPLTTTLNYGPVAGDGTAEVTLTFDHRVLDGGPAARALAEVEAVLNGPVLAELRGPAAGRAA